MQLSYGKTLALFKGGQCQHTFLRDALNHLSTRRGRQRVTTQRDTSATSVPVEAALLSCLQVGFFSLSRAECNLHRPASFNKLKGDISRSHRAGLNSSFLFSLEMQRRKMSREFSSRLRHKANGYLVSGPFQASNLGQNKCSGSSPVA